MKQKIKQFKKVVQAKRAQRKNKDSASSLEEAIRGIPRITNETVAEHREEVLSSARKYIYPLQHSAHRVVIISTSLVVVGLVSFFTYSLLALYRFHSTSTFIYRVTQVIPFPVAKAGPSYVAYENYLFELRHYIHYYQTQQKIDFSSTSGKQQLADFRQRALNNVINDAYIKQLASENHVTVSNSEINDAVATVEAQNNLGDNSQVLTDVLKEFWGWSIDDFRRELRQEILAQKVVSKLDTGTHARADSVVAQLKQGGDFAALAAKYSDDKSTSSNGGVYSFTITKNNRDLSPKLVDAIFKLQPGQTSDVINTGSALEIVQLKDKTASQAHAAHISFNFKDVQVYIDQLTGKEKSSKYISL